MIEGYGGISSGGGTGCGPREGARDEKSQKKTGI